MVKKMVAVFAAMVFFSIQSVLADDLDRHVIVVNATQWRMTSFYASNVDRTSWENDILGTKVLLPYSKVRIDIDDGWGYCRYDFKAVMSNGREIIRQNVNVCTATKWTIYEE
jgi:hypothetical protein